MQSFLFWAALVGWAIVIGQNAKFLRNVIEYLVDKVRG
jgi:hypothetical protein